MSVGRRCRFVTLIRLSKLCERAKSSASTPSTVGLFSTHVTEWSRDRPYTVRRLMPCRMRNSLPSNRTSAAWPRSKCSVSSGQRQENEPSSPALMR